MSTLKSDNSDLTINADGSGKNIKLQANGSEKVVIKSDGKVGIGTIDPANTLHVKKDVDDFVCKIENDGNSTSSDGLWIDTRWNTSNNTMLKVTTNSGTAEVLRVTPAGLTFNGDTAAANALDDYEEGTWKPSFSINQSVVTDAGHSVQVGSYTKTGDLVHLQGRLTLSSLEGFSGNVRITGCPFTSNNTVNSFATMNIGYASGLAITARTSLTGYVNVNNTTADIQTFDETTGVGPLISSQLTLDGGVIFSMDYKV